MELGGGFGCLEDDFGMNNNEERGSAWKRVEKHRPRMHTLGS